jgi:hypothetical protein
MGKPELRGRNAEKELRGLIALNYILKHPTGSEMTYALDGRGLEECRKLRERLKTL